MLNSLSIRERRLIAVALLVALLALALYAVVLPLVDGFTDRTAAREALLETYRTDERAVAQLAALRRAADAQRRTVEPYRLTGRTAVIAADQLRERIGGAIVAAGGDLRGVEDVAATPGTIRVRTDARLTTPQLARVVAVLQNSPPLAVIDSLTVTADQALQTGRPGPMDVRLEISAPYPAAAPR